MGHRYEAVVEWRRDGAEFRGNRYSRAHRWLFDEGLAVPASASPLHVRAPLSRADAVDPEEAFVAALSSCHMLFFLSFASSSGHVVDRYDDRAEGLMSRGSDGRERMVEIVLRPAVAWAGDTPPDAAAVEALHHRAHEACYLAQSVTATVRVETRDSA